MDKTCDHCGQRAIEFANIGPNQDWRIRCILDSRDTIAEQRDQNSRELDEARERMAKLRDVVIVRDPGTGGWECMSCNRTAAYNGREDLEHEDGCALATPPAKGSVTP